MNEADHYQRAMRCAIIPAAVGVTIVILYRLTRFDLLIIVGFIALLAGFIAYCIGMRSVYVLLRSTVPQLARRPSFLLNFNLLLAAACVFAGGAMALNPPITWAVTNRGSASVEDVWIEHGPDRIAFGNLAPGQTNRVRQEISSGNVRVIWWSSQVQHTSDLGHRDIDSVLATGNLEIQIDQHKAQESRYSK